MKSSSPQQSQAQLGERIRLIAADVIENKLRHDREHMITITGVNVSGDLHNVDIFYTVLGSEATIAEISDYLKRSTGVFRTAVAKVLPMRRAPKINLLVDPLIMQIPALESKFQEIAARDAELEKIRSSK